MCVVTSLWVVTWAQGGDLAATIELAGPRDGQRAMSDSVNVGRVRRDHATLQVKSGEPLTLRWTVRNTGLKLCENTLVHFLVAPQDSAGRGTPSHQPQQNVLEGAVTMDFNPTNTASGTLSVRLHERGAYLARVEARQTDAANPEATTATISVQVK